MSSGGGVIVRGCEQEDVSRGPGVMEKEGKNGLDITYRVHLTTNQFHVTYPPTYAVVLVVMGVLPSRLLEEEQ